MDDEVILASGVGEVAGRCTRAVKAALEALSATSSDATGCKHGEVAAPPVPAAPCWSPTRICGTCGEGGCRGDPAAEAKRTTEWGDADVAITRHCGIFGEAFAGGSDSAATRVRSDASCEGLRRPRRCCGAGVCMDAGSTRTGGASRGEPDLVQGAEGVAAAPTLSELHLPMRGPGGAGAGPGGTTAACGGCAAAEAKFRLPFQRLVTGGIAVGGPT